VGRLAAPDAEQLGAVLLLGMAGRAQRAIYASKEDLLNDSLLFHDAVMVRMWQRMQEPVACVQHPP
jgi:hypothetical protein